MKIIKDAVHNEMTNSMLLDLNQELCLLESQNKRVFRLPVPVARNLLNYIFDLEQDLRWNTSKYGVVPPLEINQSDGRLENLPGQ